MNQWLVPILKINWSALALRQYVHCSLRIRIAPLNRFKSTIVLVLSHASQIITREIEFVRPKQPQHARPPSVATAVEAPNGAAVTNRTLANGTTVAIYKPAEAAAAAGTNAAYITGKDDTFDASIALHCLRRDWAISQGRLQRACAVTLPSRTRTALVVLEQGDQNGQRLAQSGQYVFFERSFAMLDLFATPRQLSRAA